MPCLVAGEGVWELDSMWMMQIISGWDNGKGLTLPKTWAMFLSEPQGKNEQKINESNDQKHRNKDII